MPYYIVAVIVVIVDQLSKLAIVNYVDGRNIATVPVWEGVFHLTSHRNAGAAFGILQGQRWFFIFTTVIVLAGIIYAIYKYEGHHDKRLFLTSLAFILGGAVGNFIDRLFLGSVIDFFDFRLINFAIFNVADAAISCGVALLLLDTLLSYRAEKQAKETM